MRVTRAIHNSQKRIIVAMSGGVDSSVAAYILKRRKQKADDILGLYMNNWNTADENDESSSSFCAQSEKDALDAQSVCDVLNINLRRISFAKEYWTGVFEPFVDEINHGRMTNPDVGCNSIVKFGAMREYAMKHLQADYIATGHYARLWYRDKNHSACLYSNNTSLTPNYMKEYLADTPEEEWINSWGEDDSSHNSCNIKTPILLAAADATKDQSYFLCGVKGYAFSNALFPLGDLEKSARSDINKDSSTDSSNHEDFSVRDIAHIAGLPTASKKESMGICFIGKRKFPDFIAKYLGYEESGDFVDIDTGKVSHIFIIIFEIINVYKFPYIFFLPSSIDI